MVLTLFVFVLLFLGSKAYNSTLLSFKPCVTPEPPMAADVPDHYIGTIDTFKSGRRLLLRGNITIVQNIKLYSRIKSGIEKKTKVRFTIKFEGISCNNMVTRMIFNSVKVKYDPTTCTLLRGNYIFDNFDPVAVGRVINFVPARELGVNVWYFGMYTKLGTYLCFDIKVLITKH